MRARALVLTVTAAAAVARAAAADCSGGTTTRIIPLPVYATEPNEGSTYGFMPVFIKVCDANGRTESILAPSVTWNDVIHVTGTVRYYGYPSDTRSIAVIGSASTRINSNLLVRLIDAPRETFAQTRSIEFRWERSAFYRFFGIGPETTAEDETSYTRIRLRLDGRVGWNLGRGWNAGLEGFAWHDDVQDLGVNGLPISRRVFPGVPGMQGATVLGQGLDLRYDSRPAGEFSERGTLLEWGVDLVEGVSASPTFARARFLWRRVEQATRSLGYAMRADLLYASTRNAPFYDLSSLGGAFILRGFTEGRFVDQNAWSLEAEARMKILETHIYGVTADWRIDPFVGAGQVFTAVNTMLSHLRPVAGLGFRAFVHPNVLGRIDIASGGEGLQVYVEIGYPY